MANINVGPASVGINPQTIADSPAYQFRMQQGTEALNRSAAARGNLLSGGTIKDALSFGQGLASTEYGNEFQRQFGLAGLNADISSGNASRNLSGLLGLTGYGLQGAQGQSGAYGNYGAAGAAGTYGGQSAINYGVGQAANTLGDYLARRNQQPRLPAALPITSPAPGLQPGGSYPNLLQPAPAVMSEGNYGR